MDGPERLPQGPALDAGELERYGRHMVLPEVGEAGQRRLKGASVLIVGAGGLGSPAALYLAAAGVGRLGLVDFDAVDTSNLQRQILHGEDDVGRPKLDSARESLAGINAGVEIVCHDERLVAANARSILGDYDVIIDGSDNFPTRFLVNDACALLDKPLVYGSIYRCEGQAAVFHAGRGPCYRCLHREPPPPGLVPSCAEGGVFGVLPGVIGTIQATEAIKLILGRGRTLLGRLLLFEALEMAFHEFRLEPDPACPLCGESPVIRELRDLEETCAPGATAGGGGDTANEGNIAPAELAARLAAGEKPVLLDVRNPYEWEICRLEDARLIPLDALAERLDELDPEAETVVYCHIGLRSDYAVKLLRRSGFKQARNLLGGLDRWAREVDSKLPTY